MKVYIDTINTSAATLRRTAICKKLADVISQFNNVSVVKEPTESSDGFYEILSINDNYITIMVRHTGTPPRVSESAMIGLVVNDWDAPTNDWIPNNYYAYQTYSDSVSEYNVFMFVTDDENNLLAIAQRRTGFFIFHSDDSVECQGSCVSTYDNVTYTNNFLNSNGGIPVIGNYLDPLIKAGDVIEYIGTTNVPLISENISNHSLPNGKVMKFAKAFWNPMQEITKEFEDDYPANIIGAGIVNNKTNNPTMMKIEVTLEDETTQKYIHIGGTNWMPYDTLTQRSWSADE